MNGSANGAAVAGLCRLRFRTPEAVFELAVPTDVPLADLLPAVLAHAGADLDEQGVEHDGWILQRLGHPPLDEELGADALDLHDGEELHLRPRREALPEVHYDDLADGLATGMRERPDTWRPALTHHTALALAVTALAGGAALLLLPGPATARAAAAAVTALLLLLGALSASRAVGDAGAGTALGATAVPYFALAGALLTTGTGPSATGARLLAGGCAGAGAAVLAMAAVGCSAPLFLGLVLLALHITAAGALLLAGLTTPATAATLAVVPVATAAFLPGLCFRLSGLRLPALPRNAEELQEGIEAVPAASVRTRSAVADGFLTAFHLALAPVLALCLATLTNQDGWAPTALTCSLSLLLLLHARGIGSIPQRLAVLVPGALGPALLTVHLALGRDTVGRLALLAALLVTAAVLATVSWTIPGRRLLPYWGRAADLLHTLAAVTVLPLALAAAGTYHGLRAIAG
ncbi:type VII secretion integral membrane protein EccD [Kitasatospora aureofaciens]|uniref:type VII secretion integral membrane protein EccD n=1 Tax=Kitasatospora aureofaciens TaxID=1894 RepID=UPI001C44B7FC|nr:type VII secretion integral membrane protein EccD [Kitasatospora aureofaciens]MBV6699323.1 type VII secretion integral membrane protein EccD [Kitasatospora aureofaciens]